MAQCCHHVPSQCACERHSPPWKYSNWWTFRGSEWLLQAHWLGTWRVNFDSEPVLAAPYFWVVMWPSHVRFEFISVPKIRITPNSKWSSLHVYLYCRIGYVRKIYRHDVSFINRVLARRKKVLSVKRKLGKFFCPIKVLVACVGINSVFFPTCFSLDANNGS
jgi:hypothetical protein